jgi:hypothetical protein
MNASTVAIVLGGHDKSGFDDAVQAWMLVARLVRFHFDFKSVADLQSATFGLNTFLSLLLRDSQITLQILRDGGQTNRILVKSHSTPQSGFDPSTENIPTRQKYM